MLRQSFVAGGSTVDAILADNEGNGTTTFFDAAGLRIATLVFTESTRNLWKS